MGLLGQTSHIPLVQEQVHTEVHEQQLTNNCQNATLSLNTSDLKTLEGTKIKIYTQVYKMQFRMTTKTNKGTDLDATAYVDEQKNGSDLPQ